jgi:4-alpha-glucanotransferase
VLQEQGPLVSDAGWENAGDLDAPLDTAVLAAIHAYVASAPCALVLAQVDDLAGETDAVNLPGTDRERPNWRRRLVPSVETILRNEPARSIMEALRIARP